MKKEYVQFLEAVSSYINNKPLPPDFEITAESMINLALTHNVVPMVYSSLKNVESAEKILPMLKSIAYQQVAGQIAKNKNFADFYKSMTESGVNAYVVKGPVCALLYKENDMRLSSDFDIIVDECEYDKAVGFIMSYGFEKSGESSFILRNKGLYVELSTELTDNVRDMNGSSIDIFNGAFPSGNSISFCGADMKTLSFENHMLYLFFHAFKHFLASGFGVRQLVDIGLYYNEYKNNININNIIGKLALINADVFALNALKALEVYFGMNFSDILNDFPDAEYYTEEFIGDIIEAGIFGKSSEDRLHSSTIVKSSYYGKESSGVKSSLFPPFSVMKKKYKILKYLPFLLPFLYLWRIAEYGMKMISGQKKVSPKASMDIADKRIDLLKKLDIIKK